MKFVIGIGNAEKKYEDTRHNIGFRVVECLSQAKWSEKDDLGALVADFGGGIFAVKPTLFVNNTGGTVERILERHPELRSDRDLLFVCDDVNLDLGKLRLRASGSAGGHHGLESVIAALGSEDFARLRIGVRNETMPEDLTGFVLGRFSSEEEKEVKGIVKKAAVICEAWFGRGFDEASKVLSQLQSVK